MPNVLPLLSVRYSAPASSFPVSFPLPARFFTLSDPKPAPFTPLPTYLLLQQLPASLPLPHPNARQGKSTIPILDGHDLVGALIRRADRLAERIRGVVSSLENDGGVGFALAAFCGCVFGAGVAVSAPNSID
jgi:hypothetical protein